MATVSYQQLAPRGPSSSTPPKQANITIFSLLMLSVALAFVWVCRQYAPPFLKPWFVPFPLGNSSALPQNLAILFAAILASIIIHEAGHLCAAFLLGFEIQGASLCGFDFQIQHRKWKLSWSPRRLLNGSISAVPSTMESWRTAMLVVVAFGPLITLFAALAAAQFGHLHGPLQLLQLAFVQVSLLIFALGLVPNGPQSVRRNDARLFLDLTLNNRAAHELELGILLSQQVQQGVRPQDYPTDLVTRLAAWRGRTQIECIFAQALFRWALDSDQVDLAEQWDSRALALSEHCDARTRNSVLASSACFDVLYRDVLSHSGEFHEHLDTAREKFEHVDFSLLFPPSFQHRARASQHLALQHFYRAPAEILRAQYELPHGIPAYNFERAQLAKLHMLALLKSGKKFHTASA